MANPTVTAIRDSIGNCRTLKKAHTAAVVVGEIVVINGQVLVAVNAKAADAENAYIYRGKIEAPKEAALAINVGDVVYWDATNEVVTKTATANTKMGVCVEDVAGAGTTVLVMLGENK